MTNKRTAFIKLTNGFGNNMFQYNAAKVLAEFHNMNVVVIPPFSNYYAVKYFRDLGVKILSGLPNGGYEICNDSNYISFFNKKYSQENILLSGYFEDYRYFLSMRAKIKNWFPPVDNRGDNDLVVHMRTGDRLFYRNEFYMKPKIDQYLRAIEMFDFDQLHIVSSMPKWDYVTKEELLGMKFHVSVPSDQSVPIEESVDNFNSFVRGLEKYKPIFVRRDVHEDFNFIRTFNNILFEHGTMSWWAAFLSDADKVGVYGPWRAWKGVSNKNLSNIPLKTWFKWE